MKIEYKITSYFNKDTEHLVFSFRKYFYFNLAPFLPITIYFYLPHSYEYIHKEDCIKAIKVAKTSKKVIFESY